MKLIQVILLPIVAFAMLSCASPVEKAYEAKEKILNERLLLVEKYQKCMEESAGDNVKAETCEQYLKAAEALR